MITWELTYAPAHRPDGELVDHRATPAQINERCSWQTTAPTAQAATDRFEREIGRMVTACKRVHTTPPQQTGHARAHFLAWIATAAMALALAGLGPALDNLPPPAASSYGYTPADLQPGEVARLEAEARRTCATTHGPEGGYIALPDGGLICTDKRGRNAITVAKVAP